MQFVRFPTPLNKLATRCKLLSRSPRSFFRVLPADGPSYIVDQPAVSRLCLAGKKRGSGGGGSVGSRRDWCTENNNDWWRQTCDVNVLTKLVTFYVRECRRLAECPCNFSQLLVTVDTDKFHSADEISTMWRQSRNQSCAASIAIGYRSLKACWKIKVQMKSRKSESLRNPIDYKSKTL